MLREYRNGYYSLISFYLATLITSIILNGFYAIMLGTPIIFLVGLRPSVSQYFLFITILALLSTVGAALGLLVGSMVKDIQAAQQAVMPTVIPLMLFSGYLIPFAKIPSYFKWLYYSSPFAYSFNALQITVYRDVVFTDCTPLVQMCGCYQTGLDYLTQTHANPDWYNYSFGILVAIFLITAVLGFISMRVLVMKKTS